MNLKKIFFLGEEITLCCYNYIINKGNPKCQPTSEFGFHLRVVFFIPLKKVFVSYDERR